jgi:hypothetical protein
MRRQKGNPINLGALNPVAEGKNSILFLLPSASYQEPFFGKFNHK